MASKTHIYDARGEVVRTLTVDEDGTRIHRCFHDLTEQVKMNKIYRENIDRKSHWRPAAHVPIPEVERAIREGWYHDNKMWKRWMNDPDNRDHRISTGRV